MIRDIGHLDITHNKDIAQQYLSFNLTRKRVTVVNVPDHIYFAGLIDP